MSWYVACGAIKRRVHTKIKMRILEDYQYYEACPKLEIGIRRGMQERTARKKCPGAVFRLFEPAEFWGLNESFLQLLELFSQSRNERFG